MASAHRALTWDGLSSRRRMAKRLAPSTLATRVRSLASSWAVVWRPVGDTPASASPCRLALRVNTRSNSARRASAISPGGGRVPSSTPPRARKVRCSAMSCSLHEVGEPSEQGVGVVGAGGGLGVVAPRVADLAPARSPADGLAEELVAEADAEQRHPAEQLAGRLDAVAD